MTPGELRTDRCVKRLEAVAALYRERRLAGDPAPALTLAQHFNVSPSTARSLVHRARLRGLLSKTEHADREVNWDVDFEGEFAALLKEALRVQSMRHEDLVKAMAVLGVRVHQSVISKIVNPSGRRREIRLAEAVAMASVLKLDIQALVPEFHCDRCGDGPASGFTCNTCGRSS